MVSYVESATFKVVDQASGPLAKIRAALDGMNKAAADLAKKGEASQRRIGQAATTSGRQQIAAIRNVDAVAGTSHRQQLRRISDEAIARRNAAREADRDIQRQIRSAQVAGRAQRAESDATTRAMRANVDRQIRSARVETQRRIAEEREASRQRAQSAREIARMQRDAQAAADRSTNRSAAQQIISDLQRQAQAHSQAATAARQRATAENQITAAVRGRAGIGADTGAAGLSALSPLAAAQALWDQWRRKREEERKEAGGVGAGIAGGAVAGRQVANTARTSTKTLEDRVATIEGVQGRREKRAEQANAKIAKAEADLALARDKAMNAATRAFESAKARDVTAARNAANAVTTAETKLQTARIAAERASADASLGSIRRRTQLDNANRAAQRGQQAETAEKVARVRTAGDLAGVPRTAVQVGAAIGTAKAAGIAKDGMVYAQNQRELLDVLGMSDEKKATIRRESDRLGGEYRQLSRGEFLELTRDAIVASKTTGDGVAIAEGMARNAANLALLYGDSNKGMEASRQFYRAADIEGATDTKDEALVFMEQLTRETLRSGKDINARSVAQAIANLGTAKFGMSPEMVGDIVSLSDNVRGQTSAYIRQMHEQLTRFNVPDTNRAAQVSAGLRRQDGSGPVQEELFFRDKFEWTKAVVKPLVEGRLGRKLDSFVNDKGQETSALRAQKAAAIDRVLSNSGLTPTAQKLMSEYLMNEDRITRQRRDRKDVNLDQAKALPDRNMQQAALAVKRKWQDFADAWTEPIQPGVAKGLSTLADMFDYLAKAGKSPEKYGPPSPMYGPTQPGPLDGASRGGFGLGALGAIIAGGVVAGTAWLAKQATEHPEKAALTAAGAGLTAAAMKLSGAAASLTGAAAAQRAAAGTGALAGAAGAAGTAGKAAGVLRTLGRAAGVAGVIVAAFEAIRYLSENKTFGEDRKPGPEAQRNADGSKTTVPDIESPKITAGKVEVFGPERPQDLKGRLEGDGYTLGERRDTMRYLREMDEAEAARRPKWATNPEPMADTAAQSDTAAAMREATATMSTLGIDLSAAMAPIMPLPAEMEAANSSGAQSILSALQEGAAAVGAAIVSALSSGVNVNVNATSAPSNTGQMGLAGR